MSPKKAVVIPASLIDDYADAKALHDAFKPTEALYVKLGDELKALVKDSLATETFTESGARFSLDISEQGFESVVDIKAARRKLGALNFLAAVSVTLKALGEFLTKPEVDELVGKEQTGPRKYVTTALALVVLFIALPVFAQTTTASVASPSVVAGKAELLTVTYTAGSSQEAANQWTTTLPPGVTATWSVSAADTAAGKSLSCGTTIPQICLVAGLNATVIGSGIEATALLSFPVALRGSQTITITATIGASPAGALVATTGGTTTVTVLSPFDLNSDGKVDGSDLTLAIAQVIGGAPCTGADFNGDGACNVLDLVLLAVDSVSAAP